MRDPDLEDTLRRDLSDQDHLTEAPMFGGLAFLVRGSLLACADHQGLLARLGKGRDTWALELPGATRLRSGSRPMHGWVRIPPDLAADPAVRARILAAALDFAGGLSSR